MKHEDLARYYDKLEREKLGGDALHKELSAHGLKLNWEGTLPSAFFREIRGILPTTTLESLYIKLRTLNIKDGPIDLLSSDSILNFLDLASELKKFDPDFENKIKLDGEDFKKILEVVNFNYNGKIRDFLHYIEQVRILFPKEFPSSEFSYLRWRNTDMGEQIKAYVSLQKPATELDEDKWGLFIEAYKRALDAGIDKKDLPIITKEDWVNISNHIKERNALKKLGIVRDKYFAEKIKPEGFPEIKTTQKDLDFYKEQLKIAVDQIQHADLDERTKIKTARSFLQVANYLQGIE